MKKRTKKFNKNAHKVSLVNYFLKNHCIGFMAGAERVQFFTKAGNPYLPQRDLVQAIKDTRLHWVISMYAVWRIDGETLVEPETIKLNTACTHDEIRDSIAARHEALIADSEHCVEDLVTAVWVAYTEDIYLDELVENRIMDFFNIDDVITNTEYHEMKERGEDVSQVRRI